MNISESPAGHQPTLRVLTVLELIDDSINGVTLTEISKAAKIPKSTLSPILSTLEQNRYICCNLETGKYSIGIKLFQLGLSYGSTSHSVEIIRKEMQYIVSETQETCHLGYLMNFFVFYLAKIDSPQPISLISYVGRKLPAYATALGKALLSGLADDEIIKHYPPKFKTFTANTVSTREELIRAVHEVRTNGFATEKEEITEGSACVAVPLHKNDRVIAALSITYPVYRSSPEKEQFSKTFLLKEKKKIESTIKQLEMKF